MQRQGSRGISAGKPSWLARAWPALGTGSLLTLVYGALIAWSVIALASMLWVLMSSLKTNKELFADVWAPPKAPQWINYAKAWSKSHMNRFFLNSALLSTTTVLATALISCMSSYVLARFRFWGSRALLVLFLAGMSIPLQLITVPLFLLFNRVGCLDSLPALGLLYVTINLPFSIFVLVGFFRSLPREMEEAAVLDGASEYQVFWRVMLPLVRPGLVTISIFNFLGVWNEYLFAMMLLSKPEHMTIPVGLNNLRVTQGYAGDWVSMIAGLVIVLIPTFAFFVALQDRIAGGMTLGALKG